MRTALVAGGGIVGLACAHRLLRAGVATTVVGPASAPTSAAWGSAGHFAVEQVEPFASRKSMRKAIRQLLSRGSAIRTPFGAMPYWLPFFLRLAGASGARRFSAGTAALASCMQRAAPAWRAMLQETGHPQLLIECGHFVVWESRRSAQSGIAHWKATEVGPASVHEATAEELKGLEALVKRPLYGAVRFQGTGQFTDVGTLLDSLEASIAADGGSRIAAPVSGIVSDDAGCAALEMGDGTRHQADVIVIAAGVASGPLLSSTGLLAPIIAERGYHIQAPTDNWPDGMPPVVFEDRSMIVTNFTNGLRASGFVEFANPDRKPDESLWRALQAHVADLGLPFGEPVARWMGTRPTLPDYLPAIGKSPYAENLYYAFGHQHLGLTLAALTAELVLDLVSGRRPAVDVRPFDLRRFSRGAR